MVSIAVALERQVLDVKAEKVVLKELNQEFMQRALVALHKDTGKMLDCLSAALPTGMLGISVKIDQHLVSRLLRVVIQLCSDGETLNRSWQKQKEHYHQQEVYAQHHGPIVLFSPLALFTRAEQFTLFVFSRTFLLAAVIDTKLLAGQWTPTFFSRNAKQVVVCTLSNNSVLLRIIRHSISDITSTRKHIARDTLIQASHYSLHLSCYS